MQGGPLSWPAETFMFQWCGSPIRYDPKIDAHVCTIHFSATHSLFSALFTSAILGQLLYQVCNYIAAKTSKACAGGGSTLSKRTFKVQIFMSYHGTISHPSQFTDPGHDTFLATFLLLRDPQRLKRFDRKSLKYARRTLQSLPGLFQEGIVGLQSSKRLFAASLLSVVGPFCSFILLHKMYRLLEGHG